VAAPVMTDRIAPSAHVLSFFLGQDVFTAYFGLPLTGVTWHDTGRLFAAAVTGFLCRTPAPLVGLSLDDRLEPVAKNPFDLGVGRKITRVFLTCLSDLQQAIIGDAGGNRFILVMREGSIRVSCHLFNDESDIDRLVECLERFRV